MHLPAPPIGRNSSVFGLEAWVRYLTLHLMVYVQFLLHSRNMAVLPVEGSPTKARPPHRLLTPPQATHCSPLEEEMKEPECP